MTDANEIITWQANTSLLYDFICVHNLEWPSLSVEWIENGKILLGTYAIQPEDNYIYVLDVTLPESDRISMEDREFDRHLDYSGFRYGDVTARKFKVDFRINCPYGEVHKSRVNMSKQVGASIIVDGSILIYNIGQHGGSPQRLMANDQGIPGWGLAWSNFRNNILFSSGDDGVICHWDLNGSKKLVSKFKLTSPVQSLVANLDNPYLFFSGGDDGNIFLHDFRDPQNKTLCIRPDSESINSICQNPFRSWLLASGGSDSDGISLWDIRSSLTSVAKLASHSQPVNAVAFSPHHEYNLISASIDKRVNLWDLRDIGSEQTSELASEGPPELTVRKPARFIGQISVLTWRTSSSN